MLTGITIGALDPADIDLVAPLWRALLDHVAELPEAIVPIRPFEQSWPIERREMLETLAGDAFVLVARRDDDVVGYAFVAVEGPDPVWYTGDRRAELCHISVARGERGNGVGTMLLDAMDAELERRGVDDLEIGVDTANHDAIRLYERRGYRADFHIFYGSPGRKPWACLAREEQDRKTGRGRFAPPGADEPPSLSAPPAAGDARSGPGGAASGPGDAS
jgi:ribosomal protein S18 acetylase RimI-like enzyme